jgi:hypothetical protein
MIIGMAIPLSNPLITLSTTTVITDRMVGAVASLAGGTRAQKRSKKRLQYLDIWAA